jgi:uncharacterized membrane protein
MNLRLALYELAARHGLDKAGTRRLHQLAGLHDEPVPLAWWLPRGLAIAAAALGGFGLILWIAANWDSLGRFGRFALLQGVVFIMCLGALWRPVARAPLGLLALLGIGGLFAYFGQTYQTGADPWQLFALWAVLALPLCVGARSDVLWTPWALVVMTAVSLWIHAHIGHRWQVEPDDLAVHAMGWGAAALLVALFSRAMQGFTGAGIWSLRTAVTLAVVMVSATAMGGLFHSDVAPHYGLGLALLAGGAALLTQRFAFDVYALSAVALGLNTLLVAGMVRWLFDDYRGDYIGRLLIMGLVAAGLLAASVSIVLRVARQHEAATGAAA